MPLPRASPTSPTPCDGRAATLRRCAPLTLTLSLTLTRTPTLTPTRTRTLTLTLTLTRTLTLTLTLTRPNPNQVRAMVGRANAATSLTSVAGMLLRQGAVASYTQALTRAEDGAARRALPVPSHQG